MPTPANQRSRLSTSTSSIEKLGGGPFLEELARAHKMYGEVLGITVVKKATNQPAVAAAQSAATEAIREYMLRVMAHRRKTDPATGELVDRLLSPINNWEDRASRPDEEDDLADDELAADAAAGGAGVTPSDGQPAEPAEG